MKLVFFWVNNFFFFFNSAANVTFLIPSVFQRRWRPDAGAEQMVGAMMKTKQRMERVGGRRKPGPAAASFLFISSS